MADMISPGVFTEEKDQGQLRQGVGEIGGALIGRSQKGPAFEPVELSNFTDFRTKFGGLDPEYLTGYTAKDYLRNSDKLTFVRVLGGGEFSYNNVAEIESGSKLLTVIRPTSKPEEVYEVAITGSSANVSMSNFDLYVSSSEEEVTYSDLSLRGSDSNYIGNVIGNKPKSTANDLYVEYNFSNTVSQSLANDDGMLETGSILSTTSATITEDGYSSANSPTVISQTFGTDTNYDLFEVITKSDGTAANKDIKVGIRNITPASDIQNSEYGEFDLIVREYTDNDNRPNILESFNQLNLDPNSPDFIARRIGDKYKTTNEDGEVKEYGNYNSKSDYIRIDMKDLDSVPNEAVPFGFDYFKKYNSNTVDPDYKLSQSLDDEYDSDVFFGEDFEDDDIDIYHNPLPTNAVNVSNKFLLSNCSDYIDAQFSGSKDLDSDNLQFTFGFQDGFDGYDPRLDVDEQSDFSTADASGSVEYRKAIDTIKNPEVIDINMLVIPEVNHRQGSPVTSYAMEVCRNRSDALAIVDMGAKDDSIDTVINTAQTIDNSYAATYYPYVEIKDNTNNKLITVPPSVVMSGVLAYTDRVAHEWYAPAGFNRGGLTNVTSVNKNLYRADRDKLYNNRINPIAKFPNSGPAVWGQKTLLQGPSGKKLDRVNIRRLLLRVKKLIASAARYLVFEQNSTQTWNRFKSLVKPILQDIQDEEGLYAFNVSMGVGETMNQADIDRNIMRGLIELQPTEAAEKIELTFAVQPTGAVFQGE